MLGTVALLEMPQSAVQPEAWAQAVAGTSPDKAKANKASQRRRCIRV